MDNLQLMWRTVKEYVKAQLILVALTFVILSIGFYLMNISFWLLWAVLLALADFLPIVGTGVFMLPWSLICFLQGNAALGGRLLLLYGILIIVRQIAEPIIVGKKIGLNPIITFLAMVVGGLIFGPIGLIGGPIAAAVIAALLRQNNGNGTGNRR